jgi:hypothetical protein
MAEDVSLLDLALANASSQKAVCGVSLVKAENPKLADQIDELIGAWPRVQFSVMEATLKRAGITIRADSISRHSRGKCSCS